jgi:hypothetical protein
MKLSALALAALVLATPPTAADDGTWTLELLTSAASNGAVCLDGSPCVADRRLRRSAFA